MFTQNVERDFKFCYCYNSMKGETFATKVLSFFKFKEYSNIPKNQAKIFFRSRENSILLRKRRAILKSLAFRLNKFDWVSKRNRNKII